MTCRGVMQLIRFLGLLAAASSTAFGQEAESYQWQPLFDPGLEPTYKDCAILQDQVAQHERQRSEAHSRCLSIVRRECASDPKTGCSCVSCAAFHNPNRQMQYDLKVCMDRARTAAHKRQEEENRRREREALQSKQQRLLEETQGEIRRNLERSSKRVESRDRDASASEGNSNGLDVGTSGLSYPAARFTGTDPSSNLAVDSKGLDGPAPGPPPGPGAVLAASMGSFDDLLRRAGPEVLELGLTEALGRWDPVALEAWEKGRSVVEGVARLETWASFVLEPAGSPPRDPLDRAVFAASEWSSFRSGPSAFAVGPALTTIKMTVHEAIGRFEAALDGFDSGDWESVDRALRFEELGERIARAMCPFCDRSLTAMGR